MSDPTDKDDKTDANKAGDVLPPERHAGLSGGGTSDKTRKASPVIEGVAEAEEASAKTSSGSEEAEGGSTQNIAPA